MTDDEKRIAVIRRWLTAILVGIAIGLSFLVFMALIRRPACAADAGSTTCKAAMFISYAWSETHGFDCTDDQGIVPARFVGQDPRLVRRAD